MNLIRFQVAFDKSHILALVWLGVTEFYIFLRQRVTRYLHALTHTGDFEVAFLAQIKADGCVEACEQLWSDSISCSNIVPSEY